MTFTQLPSGEWPKGMTVEMSTVQALGMAQAIIDTLKVA